ncbi:apolipoprotein N-acyltransferase [Oculatella sp. LEGE 06141]|nr:apolipoprotein N-acyltransferase [Oculatella sp. LEGE 06141]MBE9181827.1 apolipoprotein N-acyltransferase [Oculatella sp. LEGE 06141]
MGLTPAPVNAWFLAWIALVPLWLAIVVAADTQSGAIQPSRRDRFWGFVLRPLLWGLGYHGLALSWITDLHPLTWMGIPWLGSIAITVFAWGFITIWGALLVTIWALGLSILCRLSWADVQQFLRARLRFMPRVPRQPPKSFSFPSLSRAPSWLRILMGTALWCALETLWSSGALYWTSLSYTQSPYNLPILHLGRLSGPMAVTAAIVAVNGCIAEAVWLRLYHRFNTTRSPNSIAARPYLLSAASLLLSLHLVGGGLYRSSLASPPENALRIGIVQGNIPTRIKLFDEGLRRSLSAYVTGYRSLVQQGVDVVLTPEGALPWLWVGSPRQTENPLYQAIVEQGVPAWVGTVGVEQNRITQSLFTLAGTGEVLSRYDKVKLVPLGEYIPFEAIVGRLISRLSPVEATMLPGRYDQRFETPFGRAIAGICYESAFAQLFRNQAAAGGEFILTASNNDPYGRAMMAQHHAQDTMRAIETDRWAARATNTGLSGIVDPHGRTVWLSEFRTYVTHADTLYRRQSRTLYVRWGDWLTPLLAAMGLVAWSVSSPRTDR